MLPVIAAVAKSQQTNSTGTNVDEKNNSSNEKPDVQSETSTPKKPLSGVFDMYKAAMGLNKEDHNEVIDTVRHEEISGTLVSVNVNTKQTNVLLEELLKKKCCNDDKSGSLLPLLSGMLGNMLSGLLNGLKGLLGAFKLPQIGNKRRTECCGGTIDAPDRDRRNRRDRNKPSNSSPDVDIDRKDRNGTPDLSKPPKPKPKPKMGKGKLGLFLAAATLAAGGLAATATGNDNDSTVEQTPQPDDNTNSNLVASSGAGLATLGVAAKMGVKALPGIGLAAGIGFGVNRALKGDFTGAGLEVLSGFAALLPGFGTAASLSIQAGLLARDNGIGVSSTLQSVGSSIVNTTSSLATSVLDNVTSTAISAKDTTLAVATSLIESGTTAVTDTLQAAQGAIGKAIGVIGNISSRIVGIVGGLASGVLGTISTLGNTITNFASGAWQKIANSDFVNGVVNTAVNVVDTVKGVFNGTASSNTKAANIQWSKEATPEVFKAINTASTKHGVSEDYMKTMAYIESRGNPNANRGHNSAKGLFQFIPSTAKAYGIQGQELDVNKNADAAARYALANKNGLRKALGREPEPWELYLAHNQGLGGATSILKNMQAGTDNISSEVRSNMNNQGLGNNLTAAQFAEKIRDKYNSYSNGINRTPSQPASTGVNSVVAARQQHGAASTATKPTFIGDSIAEGYKKASNASGDTKVGRSPQQVLTAINDNLKKDPNAYKGKQVYLSTGLSNNVQDTATVEKQLATLKAAGAIVTVYGVSNTLDKQVSGAKPTELNQKLGQMAASSGAKFLGGFNASSDNVHPTYSPVSIAPASKPTGTMTTRKFIRAGESSKTPAENLEAIRKKVSENPNYYKGNIVELVTGINKDSKDTASVAEQIKVLSANGADVRLVKVPEESGHRAKIAQNLNKTLATVATANKSQMVTSPLTTATNREVTGQIAVAQATTQQNAQATTRQSPTNTGGSGGAVSTPITPATSQNARPETEGTKPTQQSASDSELIAAGKKATTWGKDAVEKGMNPAFLEKYYAMAGEYANTTKKGVFVSEAFRTSARQAELRAKYPNKAAAPGLSMHEYGLAMDIGTDTGNAMASSGLLRKYGFIRPYSSEPWHIEHESTRAQRAALRNNDEATRSKAASLIAGASIKADAVTSENGVLSGNPVIPDSGGLVETFKESGFSTALFDAAAQSVKNLFNDTPDVYVQSGYSPTSGLDTSKDTAGQIRPTQQFKRTSNTNHDELAGVLERFNSGGMRVEGKGQDYIANNPQIFNNERVSVQQGQQTYTETSSSMYQNTPRGESINFSGVVPEVYKNTTFGKSVDFILNNINNVRNKDYDALTRSVLGAVGETSFMKSSPMLSKASDFITGNLENIRNKNYSGLVGNLLTALSPTADATLTTPPKQASGTDALLSDIGLVTDMTTVIPADMPTTVTSETASMDRFNAELRAALSGTMTPPAQNSSTRTSFSEKLMSLGSFVGDNLGNIQSGDYNTLTGNALAALGGTVNAVPTNPIDNMLSKATNFVTDHGQNIRNGDYTSVLSAVTSFFNKGAVPSSVVSSNGDTVDVMKHVNGISSAPLSNVGSGLLTATPTTDLRQPVESRVFTPTYDSADAMFNKTTSDYAAQANKPPVVINQMPQTNTTVNNSQSKDSLGPGVNAPIRVRNNDSVIRDALTLFMKQTM